MNNSEFSDSRSEKIAFQTIQNAHPKLEGILGRLTVYGSWSMPVSAAGLYRIAELDI